MCNIQDLPDGIPDQVPSTANVSVGAFGGTEGRDCEPDDRDLEDERIFAVFYRYRADNGQEPPNAITKELVDKVCLLPLQPPCFCTTTQHILIHPRLLFSKTCPSRACHSFEQLGEVNMCHSGVASVVGVLAATSYTVFSNIQVNMFCTSGVERVSGGMQSRQVEHEIMSLPEYDQICKRQCGECVDILSFSAFLNLTGQIGLPDKCAYHLQEFHPDICLLFPVQFLSYFGAQTNRTQRVRLCAAGICKRWGGVW